METEGSLPLLQKPATCHYIEHCCMAATRNAVFGFHLCRTKPDDIIQNMESH